MKLITKILLLLTLLITLYTCKDNPVGPDDSNAVPGRRDYTWVADTIGNPFLHFFNIWGNTPNNIWAAGAMMSDALYRYDGQKWNLDNRVYISDPNALWGDGNSMWIGNDKGCIWKFTGDSYTQQLTDFKVDGSLCDLIEMAGSSGNEIFSVGYNEINPVIIKYNGISWSLDKKLNDSGVFNQIKYCSKNFKYYLRFSLADYSTRIYEYDKKDLKIIYEYSPSNAGPTISEIDGYAYIVIGKKIYRYFNGNMEFIFEVNDPNFGGVVWGRNRNDITIRMKDGVAHYNGTDWKYLFKSPDPVGFAPNSAIFKNDVFIPAKNERTGSNIIYHGILK